MTVFCSNCGTKIEDTARFCPSCGQQNTFARGDMVAQKPIEIRPAQILVNACPVCHLNDMVVKASVIYAEGTHESSSVVPVMQIHRDSDDHYYSSTNYETVHGASSSQLAQFLSPPPKPEPPYHGFVLFGFSWWNIEIGLYFCMVFGFVFAAAIGFSAGGSVASAIVGKTNALVAVGAVLGAFIGVVVNYLMFKTMLKFVKGKKKAKVASDLAVYQPALAEWERGMAQWQNLYFCKRDGKAFLPA
jgi:hypothetical protein